MTDALYVYVRLRAGGRLSKQIYKSVCFRDDYLFIYLFLFGGYFVSFLFVRSGNTGEHKGIRGNTREYRGIQGNTGEYKGIHRNTREYRRIQANTRESRRTQGNTGEHKGIQANTREYRGTLK